ENKIENFPFLETPVAVLAGHNTCSSGEITFLSLRGRPNTQSFGEETAGSSSGNVNFPIDGNGPKVMHICTSIAQDRHSNGVGGKLSVDNPATNPLATAIAWLNSFSPAATNRRNVHLAPGL